MTARDVPLSATISPAPAVRRRWTPSLRLRLLALFAATVVPLTAFGVAALVETHRAGRAAAIERTLLQARALRVALEGELDGRVSAVLGLADSRALRRADWDSFRARAVDFLARQGPGTTLGVILPDNTILLAVGAATPLPPMTRRANTEITPRMMADPRPLVSNLFQTRISGQLGFSVDVPVLMADGTMPYYLSVNFGLEAIGRLVERQDLPEGWVMAVLDGTGTIVARRPLAERFVGQKASPDFAPHQRDASEGALRTTTVDGHSVSAVYSRSERYGWTVGLGVPEDVLEAPLLRRLGQFLVIGGALLALSFASAWLIARRIETSLRRLARAATLAPTGLREVDDLAGALAERESRLRATYLAAPVGLAYVDRDLRYVAVNDWLADLHGLPAEAHPGRSMREVLGKLAPLAEEPARRVIATGEPVQNMELRVPVRGRADGVRHLLASFQPVRDVVGQVIGASIAVTEITERKHAEERQILLAREV
ncbi:MAG TPA: PAS domain-containing protein, partial [Acetobacteraceae bacterium]|nr:PAS domain-containing protein [Acetobacteraceae bacterium]